MLTKATESLIGDKDKPSEQFTAEFDFDDVSEDDMEMVEPGCIFHWTIYASSNTSLVFRR